MIYWRSIKILIKNHLKPGIHKTRSHSSGWEMRNFLIFLKPLFKFLVFSIFFNVSNDFESFGTIKIFPDSRFFLFKDFSYSLILYLILQKNIMNQHIGLKISNILSRLASFFDCFNRNFIAEFQFFGSQFCYFNVSYFNLIAIPIENRAEMI